MSGAAVTGHNAAGETGGGATSAAGGAPERGAAGGGTGHGDTGEAGWTPFVAGYFLPALQQQKHNAVVRWFTSRVLLPSSLLSACAHAFCVLCAQWQARHPLFTAASSSVGGSICSTVTTPTPVLLSNSAVLLLHVPAVGCGPPAVQHNPCECRHLKLQHPSLCSYLTLPSCPMWMQRQAGHWLFGATRASAGGF